MARGRIIGHNLGDSEKIEALPNDTHRFAYVLLVAWADAEGRFLADAVSLNGKLYTRCGWTPATVEAALVALHNVNLIVLYQHDRKRYGVIVDFHKFNIIRLKDDGEPREEAPSRLPQPPAPDPAGDPLLPDRNPRSTLARYAERVRVPDEPPVSALWEPRATPEQLRSNPGVSQVEVEVEVEVEREVEGKEDLQPLSTSSTRETPNAFLEAWNANRGHLPGITTLNAARKAKIAALRKEHGADALALFADAARAVALDDYWVQKQYGIDNLLKPGRVLEKAEKYRAGAVQLGDASLRMATQVARWDAALDAVDAERPVN